MHSVTDRQTDDFIMPTDDHDRLKSSRLTASLVTNALPNGKLQSASNAVWQTFNRQVLPPPPTYTQIACLVI